MHCNRGCALATGRTRRATAQPSRVIRWSICQPVKRPADQPFGWSTEKRLVLRDRKPERLHPPVDNDDGPFHNRGFFNHQRDCAVHLLSRGLGFIRQGAPSGAAAVQKRMEKAGLPFALVERIGVGR